MVMNTIKIIWHLIRPHENLPLSMTALFAAVIFKKLEFSILQLFLFSSFISFFGFVINDIADAKLDRLNKKTRNPIAQLKISKYNASFISFVLLLISLYFLSSLPNFHIILGILVILLYFLYSFILRAKAKPPFDLVFHGLGPAIFFVMGYTLYQNFDLNGLMLSTMVFLLSGIAELLQESRDFLTDKRQITNTVLKLGQEASIKLSIIFLISAAILVLYLIYIHLLSSKVIIGFPLWYFILSPLMKSLKNHALRQKLIYIYSRRLMVLAVVFAFLNLI